jgi:hypothetical protein
VALSVHAADSTARKRGPSGNNPNAESVNKLDVRISREIRTSRMSPAGLEDITDSSGSMQLATESLALACALSPDLRIVVDNWPALPHSVRAEILATVRRVAPNRPAM